MKEFHHIGVPTTKQRDGETYLEEAKLYVTDPTASDNAIEWLRFEADSPMPEELQTRTHVSFKVDDIEAAIEGKDVLIPPFEAMPGVTVAFIMDDVMPIEFMQIAE